jgi:hypothetical protein
MRAHIVRSAVFPDYGPAVFDYHEDVQQSEGLLGGTQLPHVLGRN